MSLASQPDNDYFEDVVLAGRQSEVTMAALPGFTAAPLSESLAPGEQLDSLRTEPELSLDEPPPQPLGGGGKPAQQKRGKRRKRRSERTSESERRSESETAERTASESSQQGESVSVLEKTQSKPEMSAGGKQQRNRRRKTKSHSSGGDPADSSGVSTAPAKATALADPLTKACAASASQTPQSAISPAAPSPATPPATPPTASPAATSSEPPSPQTPSDSLPSSPEHGPTFRPDDQGKRYAALNQQHGVDDMLPARPVFLAHACHVCKRLHSKQCRLKSCGSCRLVAYCSAEHQRAHWPLHRALCKVVTRQMRKLGTDHLYREALNVVNPEKWKQIRFKHMTVCEEMLSRPMEAYEKEMFLYPRACDTCHETTPELLHTCHQCHSVSYCCDAHLRKMHSKFCKDLRLLVDIHCYQNEHGVCDPMLPDKMLTTYENLPPNIREFLVVSMLGPVKAYGMGNIELAVLSEFASYPLTLLYALQNIPVTEAAHISRQTELTVHVVGAEFSAECDTITKWDVFLLNVLPGLRKLHVVFIGPELEIAGSRPGVTEEDFTCEPCRGAGKRFTCEFQPNTYYHQYCRSPQFRPPGVICAFNAGIYRTTGHERRDSWLDTIPYLVPDAGVPLILTAYTLLECPQDVARIQQEHKVDVLLPPMKNPYRSTRPAQNFLNEHDSPLIYKNQYVACLTAASAKPRK